MRLIKAFMLALLCLLGIFLLMAFLGCIHAKFGDAGFLLFIIGVVFLFLVASFYAWLKEREGRK